MKPTLVVNPRSDTMFVSFADMLVEHGAASPAELEERLRAEYPDAVVHARILVGEPVTIWYVYRDGRWVPSRTGDESTSGAGDVRSERGSEVNRGVDAVGSGRDSNARD
jgi:hypothetical protein